MSKPRPTYTEEFRRDAVELLRTSGKPAAQVARELGVSVGALRTWREALLGGSGGNGRGAVGDEAGPEASAKELWDDNLRLRKEVAYLKRQSCSENRCARIMRKRGINARQKAAFRPKTTVADPDAKPAPNLLKDAPAPTGPGELYVGDITYVATREGWLYLAVVIDLYSRKVAGWQLADHMRTSLCTAALGAAMASVPPAPGAISHTDRGCQYTSQAARSHLSLLGLTQSMSAKGYCYDNAKAESFFATLKREAFPDGCCFDTKAEARMVIFDYLETFYNRRRRHSSLGNISPDEFLERRFTNTKTNLN